MNLFHFTDIQAEKANAVLKQRKIRKIASLLRFVEVCFVLIFISRLLPLHIPVAFKNSSEYFRDFSVLMSSRCFIFLIGNAIIITLFVQSGHFSNHGYNQNNIEPEIIHDNTKNEKTQGEQKFLEKQNIETEDSTESEKQSFKTENIIQREKQSIKTKDSIMNERINGELEKYPKNRRTYPIKKAKYAINKQRIDAGNSECGKNQNMETEEASIGMKMKGYRRCETEILRLVQNDKENQRRVLLRCETENIRKSIQPAAPEEMVEISSPEDHMSNDEFRRTVEAFIARQQRLLREEEEDYSLI
ncbi:PREDICTED: uncharacterized protein LOC109363344 [Lupinus angustifolius]|uniref:uncharacterized protein LOC109325919 n=1 Tax=Lupinus angustifolius TaxID=3871 RepID=UPI00092FD55C|nr:PREDICTED: uncharacterized protein LOC109325919 [Lupinus angustifolius]XP_019465126.1 PREDICTED: uncharacterized protein LOC109363344 [Lupinus angustifolius]